MSNLHSKAAKEARIKVLELIFKAGTSHIGSCLSAIDLMAVLFSKIDLSKDEAILSAGWKAAAWYYFLWKKEIITEDELNSFCKESSPFIGLVEPQGRWGLRVAGGSMGWGAAMSVGLATAKKVLKQEGNVYVFISDGELQTETMGSVARNAVKRKLDNLIFILDNNKFCAMGKTSEVLPVDPYKLFYGWNTADIDGHDYFEIRDALDNMNDFVGNPKLIIANTIKGKGIPEWEGNNLWHYAQIKEDDYKYALSCLT